MTPRTSKWRLEATAINRAVMCGGVQVRPGDVVIADETGVCFVPVGDATNVLLRVLESCRVRRARDALDSAMMD